MNGLIDDGAEYLRGRMLVISRPEMERRRVGSAAAMRYLAQRRAERDEADEIRGKALALGLVGLLALGLLVALAALRGG